MNSQKCSPENKEPLIDHLRNLMGWCPQAQAHRLRTIPDRELVTPAPQEDGGPGLPVPRFGWMNRYRNRTLAFALCMTGVGISLFATAVGDRISLLALGLVLATLLWISEAVSYWRLFTDVERCGIARENSIKKNTVLRIIPIIGTALILACAGIVLLGLVPGVTMRLVDGFLAGFAAIAWYHFAMVIVWERKTGIDLYSDGKRFYRRT